MTCLWLVYTLNTVCVVFCADHGFSLCCQKIEMDFDTQAACADEALGVVQYCSINEIQYSFKFRPLLEIIVQNIYKFKF